MKNQVGLQSGINRNVQADNIIIFCSPALILCLGLKLRSDSRFGDWKGLDLPHGRPFSINGPRKKVCTVYTCAVDFSLLNLPKGKSLGRSKPTTNS
jgi:hypothetical protein